MSQAGELDVIKNHPEIPTSFPTNMGTAVPLANELEILGTGSTFTTGVGNVVTIELIGLTQYNLLIGQGTDTIGLIPPGTSGYVLTSTGLTSNPTWQSPTSIGAILQIAVDATSGTGTNPVLPDGSGQITISGGQYVAGAFPGKVVTIVSPLPNTLNVELQISSAVAGTDNTKNGLSHFDNSMFSVDANGFVQLIGGGTAVDSFAMQTGTSPVVPTAAGLVTFNGAVVAAGTNPVRTDGTGANTMALEVQISQAIAATDATKIGLCNFDSARFTVDANGFVSANGSGLGETITGDSGGALSPTAGNWNILGRSGSKTSGSGSTLTIKSPPYSDQGGSTTVTLNSGSFATAAITLTLPASAGIADGDLCEFVCTSASALVIQAAAAQTIQIGTITSSAAGTATSTSTGDSVSLRWSATASTWFATSVIGTWVMA